MKKIAMLLLLVDPVFVQAQSAGDILRHLADCEDAYKISNDYSADLRCVASVEDEIDRSGTTYAEPTNGSTPYRAHTTDDIDLVIADGNVKAAADGVGDLQAAQKELAAQLAKHGILTGDALDTALKSFDLETAVLRPITIDKMTFPTDSAKYHAAWHAIPDIKLAKFGVDIDQIRPSVQWAVDHDGGDRYKDELSFLTYARSDVTDEIHRRK